MANRITTPLRDQVGNQVTINYPFQSQESCNYNNDSDSYMNRNNDVDVKKLIKTVENASNKTVENASAFFASYIPPTSSNKPSPRPNHLRFGDEIVMSPIAMSPQRITPRSERSENVIESLPESLSSLKQVTVSLRRGSGLYGKNIQNLKENYEKTMDPYESDSSSLELTPKPKKRSNTEKKIAGVNEKRSKKEKPATPLNEVGPVANMNKQLLMDDAPNRRYKQVHLKPQHPQPRDPSEQVLANPSLNEYMRTNVMPLVQNMPTFRVDKSRRFVDFIQQKNYHMFIVKEQENVNSSSIEHVILYANTVASINYEYSSYYYNVDKLVHVVTFNRYRFMISHRLLTKLNVHIPESEQFPMRVHQDASTKCHFNEIKDYVFMNELNHMFNLDMVMVQTELYFLMSAIGPDKGKVLIKSVMEHINDDHLFVLPINLSRQESKLEDIQRTVASVSLYVQNIVSLSKDVQFKQTAENFMNRDDVINYVTVALKFWLRSKNEKNVVKEQSDFFTYKYGSVVRLLFKESIHTNALLKIKRETGHAGLIDNYLEANQNDTTSNSFILINTKMDERITIIKKGPVFLWITSIIKDIIAMDLIEKYKKHTHHVFNLSNTNRKEMNNKHNGMIKLLSFYTSNLLMLDELKKFAVNNFNCSYDCKHYA
uniref:Immediate early protein 1 n=1 Tax=Helicoverpa armigera nucleopolyhedrovirus TaxID=51313 RepID=A0A0E3JA36_9ABAC|nr:immediate early protein 1 [Helicoverpa armigera nucleopolyhedrovirus]AJP07437.1 immediate early protein 1 [Helicoverpa armigera nucleopolyhedrovirus]